MHEVPQQATESAPTLEKTLADLESHLYWTPVDVRNAETLARKSYVGMDMLQKHIGLLRSRKQGMETLLERLIGSTEEFHHGELDRYSARVAEAVEQINRAEQVLNAISQDKIY